MESVETSEANESAAAKTPGRITARIGLFLSLLAPGLAVGGAYLAHKEVLGSLPGFGVFALSLPVAALGFLIALLARFLARGERNRRARRTAFAASTLCVVTVAAVMGLALPAVGFPRINDITTDREDPPVFVTVLTLAPNVGRDMNYPPSFADQQKQAYPSIGTLKLGITSDDAFGKAREALGDLPDTEVIDEDREAGRIEAVSTSGVFRFKDDVVVRVRPTRGGSVIDIRSKSRDGQGDMGVNARRIENFFGILH